MYFKKKKFGRHEFALPDKNFFVALSSCLCVTAWFFLQKGHHCRTTTVGLSGPDYPLFSPISYYYFPEYHGGTYPSSSFLYALRFLSILVYISGGGVGKA